MITISLNIMSLYSVHIALLGPLHTHLDILPFCQYNLQTTITQEPLVTNGHPVTYINGLTNAPNIWKALDSVVHDMQIKKVNRCNGDTARIKTVCH